MYYYAEWCAPAGGTSGPLRRAHGGRAAFGLVSGAFGRVWAHRAPEQTAGGGEWEDGEGAFCCVPGFGCERQAGGAVRQAHMGCGTSRTWESVEAAADLEQSPTIWVGNIPSGFGHINSYGLCVVNDLKEEDLIQGASGATHFSRERA